jgi:cobalt-zinc-cadmium efflux system outer membrane protein
MTTSCRNRRKTLRLRQFNALGHRISAGLTAFAVFVACTLAALPASAQNQGPVRISLDDAIQMAMQHNHNMIAMRTTIQQSEAEEITQGLRPNPSVFADWEYLPIFGSPASQNPGLYAGQPTSEYLHNNTEADLGLSYLFERGGKRLDRLQAQKDVTAQTRSLVSDGERNLTFQVATLFFNAQLAESTLDLAQQDLKSFQATVDISETQFKDGGLSENDYLMIKLQLLQFQSDVEQAQLAKVQSLSDLRQLLGYESVGPDYDVENSFAYQPVKANLEDLQMKALQNRPDLRAVQQGVNVANSQLQLQKANGKQDVTVQANYTHSNGISGVSLLGSIPLAIHNRNQGEITRAGYAVTQAQQQEMFASGQVMTDVKDAYEGLLSNDRVVQLYISTYLDAATRSRDISDYAYHRGGISLLDFLDAERTYRSTELAYRQTLASYLTAVEQLREAVGTRALP